MHRIVKYLTNSNYSFIDVLGFMYITSLGSQNRLWEAFTIFFMMLVIRAVRDSAYPQDKA